MAGIKLIKMFILIKRFVHCLQEFSLVVCNLSSVLCSSLATSSLSLLALGWTGVSTAWGKQGGGAVDVDIISVDVYIAGVNDVDVGCSVGDKGCVSLHF